MAQHGMARHGTARHGMAWHGMAWHGMAWHGMAWHGMAWHGRMCHLARSSGDMKIMCHAVVGELLAVKGCLACAETCCAATQGMLCFLLQKKPVLVLSTHARILLGAEPPPPPMIQMALSLTAPSNLRTKRGTLQFWFIQHESAAHAGLLLLLNWLPAVVLTAAGAAAPVCVC
jgi:hypothetical protein